MRSSTSQNELLIEASIKGCYTKSPFSKLETNISETYFFNFTIYSSFKLVFRRKETLFSFSQAHLAYFTYQHYLAIAAIWADVLPKRRWRRQ